MELENLKSDLEESKSRAEARAKEELINLASGKGKKATTCIPAVIYAHWKWS